LSKCQASFAAWMYGLPNIAISMYAYRSRRKGVTSDYEKISSESIIQVAGVGTRHERTH
jgi:hypothetical protein